MPPINFRVAFLPVFRASPNEFWMALGLIALIDAGRMTLSPAGGLFTWLFILFFVASAHINRLRDAGRQGPLVIIPLAVATLAKLFSWFIGFTMAALPDFMRFLEEQGINLNDPAAVQAAAYDPSLQEAYQRRLENDPQFAIDLLAGGAWPSMWGFWLAILAMAFWFGRMPRA